MRKETTDWEEVFTNEIYDERLCHDYRKNSENSIVRTQTTQVFKWTFPQRRCMDSK